MINIIVGVATAIICVLLAVVFSGLSRRTDDLRAEMNRRFDNLETRWNDKFANLSNSVQSNTEKVGHLRNYLDGESRRKGLSIIKLEDEAGIKERPLSATSAVALTDNGIKMLRESGMDVVLAKYEQKLMEKVKIKGLSASSTIAEVEEVAKVVIDDYPDWDEADEKVVNDYMSGHSEGRMFDIWEIAGIRFRDMILVDLGMLIPNENKGN